MMQWIKKNCGVIILVILFPLIPIIINWAILQPCFFTFVGEGANWLNFWVTYLSAYASFCMVYFTWKTLKQNKGQLDEMKRQWDMEHCPHIDVYLVKNDYSSFSKDLEILNWGKSPAYNISIRFDENLICQVSSSQIQNLIRKLNEESFYLLPMQTERINLFRTYSLPNGKFEVLGKIVDKEEYDSFVNLINNAKIPLTISYNEVKGIRQILSSNRERKSYISVADSINKLNGIVERQMNINSNQYDK